MCVQVGMKKEWIMTEVARMEKKQRVEENRERRMQDGMAKKSPGKASVAASAASDREETKLDEPDATTSAAACMSCASDSSFCPETPLMLSLDSRSSSISPFFFFTHISLLLILFAAWIRAYRQTPHPS